MLQHFKRLLVRRQFASGAAQVQTSEPNRSSKPLITCRRTQFNLLELERSDVKFGAVPLCSKGWLHNKSKGDHFTLNATITGEQRQAAMHNLQTFLAAGQLEMEQQLLKNLQTELGINHLTDIQAQAIPIVDGSFHTLIAAETGCGKTLAYLLPVINKRLKFLQRDASESQLNAPTVLILTPGRELATQIAQIASKLCEGTDLKVKALLGGNTKQQMMNPEFEKMDILVATLGAVSKLVTTGIYRMEQVRHVVLDEADTLLDDSFTDKLTYFLRRFPFHRNHVQDESIVGTQLLLASATMPTNTREILQKVIDVETIRDVVSPHLHYLMPHVTQKFMRISKADRPANLLLLAKQDKAKKRPFIVFSNKSTTSDYVSIFLNNSGINCLNLNGDMLMKIRLGRFEEFQRGNCDVLSTTDVGSRGLDTTRARHVINFDFPLHVSDYIHRCGRIGRVGSMDKSLVTNFISSRREIDVVQRIEHAARTGGLLPDVNANIKNIINKRIMAEMKQAGIAVPQEEAF
ncbi:probable ATP-dependent RNA helicase DDX28 [Drosophila sulfurigaster albostrigata]|uniref:probable ATP-dependent RNA helicase DDX28 n=1 Tax=Drosophila sulfurigaster albostrigata TaxID=89887 RepID=UPI002D21BA32|nr:probable ATP-dependent RNA helicase DDX28 [Drosophila sulfurigaster albostrigata]